MSECVHNTVLQHTCHLFSIVSSIQNHLFAKSIPSFSSSPRSLLFCVVRFHALSISTFTNSMCTKHTTTHKYKHNRLPNKKKILFFFHLHLILHLHSVLHNHATICPSSKDKHYSIRSHLAPCRVSSSPCASFMSNL